MEKQVNSLFLEKTSKNVQTNTTVKNSEEKKEPSLFDSLLKGKTIDTDSSNNESKVQKNDTKIKEDVSKQDLNVKSSSLLDRLIQEAKKDTITPTETANDKNVVKKDNLIESETQTTESIVQSVENSEVEINKDKNISQESSKKILNNQNNTDKFSVENSSENSLNDKNSLQTNQDNSSVKEANIKQDNVIIEQVKVEKIAENNIQQDNNSLNKDTNVVDETIEKLQVDSNNKNEIVSNENPKIQKSTDDSLENEKQGVIKLSLLDRLIQEAKKEIKKDTDKVVSPLNETTEKIDTATNLADSTTEIVDEGSLKVDKQEINEISNEKQDVKIIESNNVDNLNNEIVVDTKDTKNIEINKNIENNELKELKEIVKDEKIAENSNTDSLKKVTSENKTSLEIDESKINQKVASQLASLNSNLNAEEVIIPKEKLNVLSDDTLKESQPKSLMDKLIEKNRLEVFGSEITNPDKKIKSDDFLTSIYLSSQKSQISNQSLINKKEAMSLASNATSLTDIEKSAQMLDLGLEDLDVQKVVDTIKKLDLANLDRNNLIDKLAFNKNIANIELKDMITTSVEASKALLEDTINVPDDLALSVNPSLAQNIQSRIIGARQNVGQMMSDLARQMYENYKPPVTAFRINLHPATLGAISIVMKNDRDNSLSISMNVSNTATLEALKDSQNVLRNSLNNIFNGEREFNLDFGSSNQNSNSSNSQNGDFNQNSNSSNNRFDTQSILKLQEGSQETQRNLDYM